MMIISGKHCWQNQLAGHTTRGEALGDGFSCRPEGRGCPLSLHTGIKRSPICQHFHQQTCSKHELCHLDVERLVSILRRILSRQGFAYLTSVDFSLVGSRITITAVTSHRMCTDNNRQGFSLTHISSQSSAPIFCSATMFAKYAQCKLLNHHWPGLSTRHCGVLLWVCGC